jgi:hypothetical protein
MRTFLLAALLAVAPAASATLAPSDIEAPVLVTRIDCHVVIDKAGRIAEYTSSTSLPAPLAERVRDMVMAVRFVPVEVDGTIVNAATDMRVALTATTLDDGGIRIALDNLSFPKAEAAPKAAFNEAHGARRLPPLYPREALRVGANADVLAVLRFGPDGSVTDAAVQQSALVHTRARPADAARVLALFEKSTLQVLRQWKVDPAGMPEDSRVGDGFVSYIPVSYRLVDRGRQAPVETRPGDWTLETRTTRRVPAWVPVAEHAPQPGVSDLADGEMGSANRRFRLAEPLAAVGS